MDTVKNVKSRQVNVSIDDEISCQDQEDNSRLDRSDRSAVAESEHDHHPGKLISSDFSVTSRKMDPYKELELYLAKVIEEIDNIIVPSLPGESVEASGESKLTSKKFETKCPPDKSIVTNQLSPTNKTLSVYVKSLNARSKVNVVETPVIQYRDLLSEFGISDDDSVDEESKNFSKVEANNNWNLKDEISLPVNNDNIDNNNKQGCLNSDYDEPKDMIPTCLRLNRKSGSEPGIPDGRMIRKENQTIRFNYDEINDGIWDDEKCNSSSLPANLEFVKIQETSRCCEIVQVKPKKILDISFKSLRRRGSTNENEGNSPKMPPKHSESRHRKNTVTPVSLIKCKLPTGTLQRAFKVPEKHSQDHNNVLIESDDNLMLKFKSPNENFHKSVPVSSSEDKSLPPFSKILRKKHSFVNKNNVNDAILVRVSSLPDQDLLDISKDRLNGKTHNFSDNLFSKKKRAISPFTLRSDIIAKRLSESDKDINQISPVKLNAVFFPVMKDDEVNSQNDRNISDISTESDRSEDVKGDYIGAFDCVDTDSRTSPVISRSSNSLWVNDCESLREVSQLDSESLHDEVTLDPASPHDTVDEDNRSSSSSQDLVQSMDEISSGSISPDTIDRASPLESGIGTASPPRSTDRQSAKPSISNKHHRKETWEKLRKRSFKSNNTRSVKGSTDVWVRRESIHVQTPRCDNGGSQEAVDSSSGIDDTLPRKKSPRPSHLPLGLAMTGSSSLSSAEMLESQIPSSPSTASLQLNYEPLTMELSEKSNSAPFLENNNVEKTTEINETVQLPCSQSNNRLSEIEAQEACKWLRAAGFPQYAQMYEDYQFPIDVSGVAKDHPFLEPDSLQSLYRRLDALNRCANMKLDTNHTHHHHNTSHSKSGGGDDSDEDTQCALSENWTYEKKTRRWSRICDISQANVERLQAIAALNRTDTLEDRLEAEESEDTMIDSNMKFENIALNQLSDELNTKFRRTGSERLRDGAKALLRRVESLKSRRRKRQNREGIVISGPQVLDAISMQQKVKDLNCVDVSPTGPAPVSFGSLLPPSPINRSVSPLTLPPSPYHLASSNQTSVSPFGDDSSSYCSDGSQGGGPTLTPTRIRLNKAKKLIHRGRDDQGALSDSECQPSSWRHKYLSKDANSNNTKGFEYVIPHPQALKDTGKSALINTRGGSLNLGKESQGFRDKLSQSKYKEDKVAVLKREDKFHKSFRYTRDDSLKECKQLSKEVTVYREKSGSRSSDLADSQESSSTMASRDSDQEDESPRHKSTVVRWHSFQRGSLYPELNPLCNRAMASMSCGQLLVLRKLSLLKLTACMERYCPTHRTGWNWELPKFIRKIKSPDYKDKTVFGVPLLLSLQRTGQALPKCIQIALRWLRTNALDQVGIFRKSGMRSRIQKLKAMTETQGDNINFDGQQAFDVADLVKQYFRELPEALLTNKLSETFIAIFQHVPPELRPDAVQCVLLLLPDEHREALETLLDFLHQVASNAPYNQMTAFNLAVCLAPSLFHLNHSNANVTNRSSSVSPRRRKTVGMVDQRELSENKAAYDCLLYLIKTHRQLFMISSDMLTQCHFNYMEESVPVGLEELGSEMKQDWSGYMHACTNALLKEAREKSRGWVTVNNPADTSVEMAYKKVGDGHPLRLWRVSTEVEAPPHELLHRVLKERHIWDPQLLKSRVVKQLATNAEIFQYAAGNMCPLPARDYCVLRTWRTDLPKDACVIVETSVQHPDAPVMPGGTRGIVLASRYLIEKCGSGKSRIMHLSRVDTKGRTPEWYNKSYGHIAALYLSKIRNSFKHTTDGPESKV